MWRSRPVAGAVKATDGREPASVNPLYIKTQNVALKLELHRYQLANGRAVVLVRRHGARDFAAALGYLHRPDLDAGTNLDDDDEKLHELIIRASKL